MNDLRAHDWVGMAIAGYRILLELDRGRGSVVFVGEDVQSHAPAAIKIIPPGPYADAVETAAPALMALTHPHIARVIACGRHEDHLYLVSEFAAFKPPAHTGTAFDASALFSKHLVDYVQEQPALLAVPDVLDMLLQILDALEYAHGLRDAAQAQLAFGSVHPHHILVQLDAAGRAHLRVTGIGMPCRGGRRAAADAYLSPEELQGSPPTHASDVYALGAIAYLLLIGIAPPAPLADPSRVRPDVAPAWDAFVHRALAFDAAERFADYEDMRRALLALRASLRSPSLFTRMKTALFVNVIVGLLVVAAIVAGVFYYRKAHPPTPRPLRSDVEIVSETDPVPPVPLPGTVPDDDSVIVVDDEITTTTPPAPPAAAAAAPLDLSGGVALAGVAATSAPAPAAVAAAAESAAPVAVVPQPAPVVPAPEPVAAAPAATPAAPVVPTAVEASVVSSYTVKPGDTLYSVARAHNVPLPHLLSFNNLTTASVLRAGQTLLLVPGDSAAPSAAAPSAAAPAAPAAPANIIEHRVQPRETYYSIARQYHCSVEELQALNNNQPLRFDTVIKVPARSAP